MFKFFFRSVFFWQLFFWPQKKYGNFKNLIDKVSITPSNVSLFMQDSRKTIFVKAHNFHFL